MKGLTITSPSLHEARYALATTLSSFPGYLFLVLLVRCRSHYKLFLWYCSLSCLMVPSVSLVSTEFLVLLLYSFYLICIFICCAHLRSAYGFYFIRNLSVRVLQYTRRRICYEENELLCFALKKSFDRNHGRSRLTKKFYPENTENEWANPKEDLGIATKSGLKHWLTNFAWTEVQVWL